jgi:hypothetical protein
LAPNTDEERELLRRKTVEAYRRQRIADALAQQLKQLKVDIPLSDIAFPAGSQRLTHLPTGEYFQFARDLSENQLFYPCFTNMEHGGVGQLVSPTKFDEVLLYFQTSWIPALVRYMALIAKYKDAPDPFVKVTQSLTVEEFANASNVGNDSFTDGQRAVVVHQVLNFKQYVIDNGTVGDRVDELEAKMQYLIEASDRLGKKDWLMIFISVVTGILVAGLFAPDRAKELLDYGLGLFAFLAQTNLLPPQ